MRHWLAELFGYVNQYVSLEIHAKGDNASYIIGMNTANESRYSCQKHVCLQVNFFNHTELFLLSGKKLRISVLADFKF